MLPDPRLLAARSMFGTLARTCGLEPDRFRQRLLWQKQDAARNHVVVAYDDGQVRLILKQVFGPEAAADLRPKAQMQARVAAALQGNPRAHAPRILAVTEDGTATLMEAFEGQTLDALLDEGREPAALLEQAGRWLAAFHRITAPETRAFRPTAVLEHQEKMRARIATGQALVPERALYLRCAAALPEIAAPHLGKPTVSALRHGDLNLRNILIGPSGVAGIDFKPAQTAPVGFDIARLLTDHAEMHLPAGRAGPGAPLHKAALTAFFRGYDLVGPDDPGLAFLAHVQLLNDWRAIPERPEARSWRQKQRLAAVTAICRNAFAA